MPFKQGGHFKFLKKHTQKHARFQKKTRILWKHSITHN